MLISSIMLASTAAFAHNLPLNSVWQSSYIPGEGTYQVNVLSKDNISVIEDLNICYFNVYGQNTGCTTNMGYYYNTGKLLNAYALDKLSSIWSLQGSNYGIENNLGYSARGYINLAKFDNNGQVVESVWLQRIQ